MSMVVNATPAVAPRETSRAVELGRPLRILHVLDHSLPLHSGYTFRTLAILSQQRALGWETFQLTGCRQGSFLRYEEHIDGWVFHRTPLEFGLAAKLPLIRHRSSMQALHRRLVEVVERTHPDILHVHSPVLNALPVLAAGKAFGIPVVYEVRAFWEDAAVDHGTAREWGPRYLLTRAMETHAMRHADAVTTICDGLRTDMLGRGIPADKITVVPNAVDLPQFPFAAAPDAALLKNYGLTRGYTLGFAGSFYAYEGLDALLRAMPQVLRVIPQSRLLLLGGGPEQTALQTLASELGIGDRVHFIGRVPHRDVTRYCSVIDVMVFPRISRRLTELVTPLKPLEAMAMGKLVAASDVGGHRELIDDGHNGHLFRAGSIDALAHCLTGLLERPSTWSEVIRNGRAFVERERNWQATVARYRDVYAAVLAHVEGHARGRHGF